MKEKSLADEMADQDAILKSEISGSTVPDNPINIDVKSSGTENVTINEDDFTIEDLEKFFEREGQWLEGQIMADTGQYERCPVCSMIPNILKMLIAALEDCLKNLDEMRESDVCPDDSILLAYLKRERAWYLVTKQVTFEMLEQAHFPRNIINAHPELHSLAVNKKISKRKNLLKKKNKRKAEKHARRHNR